MATKTVHVTVVSDVVCPFCWVGKRSIDLAAQALAAQLKVQLHFKPFQLAPDVPEAGVDRMQYMSAKFGADRAKLFLSERSPLNQRGNPIGLEFVYHPGSKAVNTRRCHRILYAAGLNSGKSGSEQVQSNVKEALLKAFHHDGRDVNNKAELRKILGDVMPLDVLDAVLTDDKLYDSEVEEELRHITVNEPTFNGVPHFIFPNGARINGAESVEKFVEVLKRC